MKGLKMQEITAKELEKRFDSGEDISEYMDFSKVQSFSSLIEDKECEELRIAFPKKLKELLDKKSKKIGVSVDNFVKIIVAERLDVVR